MRSRNEPIRTSRLYSGPGPISHRPILHARVGRRHGCRSITPPGLKCRGGIRDAAMIEIGPAVGFPDYPKTPFRSRASVALPTSFQPEANRDSGSRHLAAVCLPAPIEWYMRNELKGSGRCGRGPAVSCDRLICKSKGTRFGNWLLAGRRFQKSAIVSTRFSPVKSTGAIPAVRW